MRLERIKLAGFKSFVDPTVLPLPGNLVGVVGPNGCGKSNIIDAVRWVMGESSAKHLRGDTMADVVFNGSSTRKPVGIASVELLFDNTDGRATAEYAAYQKIAIKRQVGRDGQSTYLLNGTRCRRKDITDLFLGTGLGARSYAIIEQGTISRLIEAKPDELREVIEEAAGISRYKERRHETEIRMRHTRENLDRLEDLRGELSKQVESLQRQVKKAERYLGLREEERSSKASLLRLRWSKSRAAMDELRVEIDALGDALRAAVSASREISEEEAVCLTARERQQAEMQAMQARFYEVGADIGRLQDQIRAAERARDDTERDLIRLEAEATRAAEELQHDGLQLSAIQQDLAEVLTVLEEAQSTDRGAAEAVDDAWQVVQVSRVALQSIHAELVGAKSRTEILRARDRQLADQQHQIDVRWERLESERAELASRDDAGGIAELRERIGQEEERAAELAVRIDALSERLRQDGGRREEERQHLNELRAEIHTTQGRLSSLELLQQHAMGKDKVAVSEWLERNSLAQTPRLAESLDVGVGWESAVEHVLGPYLEALCVLDAQPYLDGLASLTAPEALAFLEKRETAPPRDRRPKPFPRLTDYVASPWDLSAILSGVFCAPDLVAARSASEWLEEHESVVTSKGERVGPGWVALQAPEGVRTGVIQRERDIRQATESLHWQRTQEQESLSTLASLEARLGVTEQERTAAEAERRGAERRILELRNASHQLAARHHQAQKRLTDLESEMQEIGLSRVELAEQRAEVADELRRTEAMVASETARSHALEQQLEAAEAAWRQAEGEFRRTQDDLHALQSRRDGLRSRAEMTAQHLERAQKHAADADLRVQQLRERRDGQQSVESEKERLEEFRRERQRLEEIMADHRRHLSALEKEGRSISERRLESDRDIEGIKSRAERARIELEGHQVREEGFHEQLAELGLTDEGVEVLSNELKSAEPKTEAELQQLINRIGQDLERLGPVNLLAVEEFAEQNARLDALEEQRDDLSQSLQALTEAIEKIDRECRTLFKGTFDRINAGFQGMFPKLFGGGNAFLDLTERDLLETGVTVIARPPGKRNSSIHLLSGGEKALTAVALVFAIFELNPAPFCLLDEVDAPLDDANVGRFCALVKEMSERVQFLFITHNKVTMETAEYLAGITMREPGVSRIVAVDIEAAVELATA